MLRTIKFKIGQFVLSVAIYFMENMLNLYYFIVGGHKGLLKQQEKIRRFRRMIYKN